MAKTEKYICIKSFKDIDGEVEKGKQYLLVKSGRYTDCWYVILGLDDNGIWIFGSAILETKISEYFITIAEWRDQQINSILDE